MLGLVPSIHVFLAGRQLGWKGVDPRDKPEDDGLEKLTGRR
jgi:hypothetical protein